MSRMASFDELKPGTMWLWYIDHELYSLKDDPAHHYQCQVIRSGHRAIECHSLHAWRSNYHWRGSVLDLESFQRQLTPEEAADFMRRLMVRSMLE